MGEREKNMQQWDSWRKYIADGGQSSWPRDAFECLLDNHDEDMQNLQQENSRLIELLSRLSDRLNKWHSDCDCYSVKEMKNYEIEIDEVVEGGRNEHKSGD